MASIKRNSVFTALQGTIGQELVFKHYTKKVVVGKYPDMSKVEPSERQKLQRAKMKEANAYAQQVMISPELRAIYEKDLQEGESLYKKVVQSFLLQNRKQ